MSDKTSRKKIVHQWWRYTPARLARTRALWLPIVFRRREQALNKDILTARLEQFPLLQLRAQLRAGKRRDFFLAAVARRTGARSIPVMEWQSNTRE